jgi:hypothetical protein
MTTLLFILTIILDAIGDALALSSKPWAHVIQAITVLLWLFIIWENDKKKYNLSAYGLPGCFLLFPEL